MPRPAGAGSMASPIRPVPPLKGRAGTTSPAGVKLVALGVRPAQRVPFMLECQAQVVAPTKTPVNKRQRSELSTSVAELHRLAPEVDEEVIEGLVQVAYDELMPAKVHSYVPILIVHQVRDIIQTRRPAA
jgi:hypothetical protein